MWAEDEIGMSEAHPTAGLTARTPVYLHPGQVFASSSPSVVTTILGSCVAICVFDSVLKVGGTNHYLLPYWAGDGVSSPRFGNVAVKQLVEKLINLGSRKADLRAKLFGGACVIDAFRGRGAHLGTKNVELGRTILQQEGIPVVADDVGGHRGRKVIFHTDTGVALVRLI